VKQPKGMTLWDWYAGMALCGALSDPDVTLDNAVRAAEMAAARMLEIRPKQGEGEPLIGRRDLLTGKGKS